MSGDVKVKESCELIPSFDEFLWPHLSTYGAESSRAIVTKSQPNAFSLGSLGSPAPSSRPKPKSPPSYLCNVGCRQKLGPGIPKTHMENMEIFKQGTCATNKWPVMVHVPEQ